MSSSDGVVGELSQMLARLTALATGPATDAATDPVEVSPAVRIDRIAVLEQVRAATAAVQNTESVAYARTRVAEHIARGDIDPRKVGRGIADELALAQKISPTLGSRRLGIARALQTDLPQTNQLLRRGAISEDLAARVVSATSHLAPDQRRTVETRLAAAGLQDLAAREAEALAKKYAYEADPAGYLARGRTARKDRRISLRPRPDTMTGLDAHLPVEQGVACYAALRRHADSLVGVGGETRSRDQIMADTLVERVTGQATAGDVNVEVGVVISVDDLVDPDRGGAARVTGPGGGPVPAGIATDILAGSTGRRWWRRLFRHPDTGALLGGDSRRALFDGVLAHLIALRDHHQCRGPYCTAPARHTDHIRPRRAGGPTSFTNGRGTCVRENLVKEMPGWTYTVIHDGLGAEPHTVTVTTPTGHTYTSRAGPAP